MWQTLTAFLVVSLVGLFGACESSTGSQPTDTSDTYNQTDTDTNINCDGKLDNSSCPVNEDVVTNDSTETDTFITNDYCEPLAVLNGEWYNVTPQSTLYGLMVVVSYKTLPQICELYIVGPGAAMANHNGEFWIDMETPDLPIHLEDTTSSGFTVALEVGVTDDGRLYQSWYEGDIRAAIYYYARSLPSAN